MPLRTLALLPLLVMSGCTAAASSHAGRSATCAMQSEAPFPGGFTADRNLVVGPLSIIGAGDRTAASTVREFGGDKFPLLVRAGRTVTVRVAGRSRRAASLTYASLGGDAITFRSCSRRESASEADGRPVTFWSGGVEATRPVCVRLRVWIDARAEPLRAHIALGRDCGQDF